MKYTRLTFFLDKKSNKKIKTAKCFLCRTCPYPANQAEPQGGTFGRSFAPTSPRFSPKLMPYPPHPATMFCLISPGSRLLSPEA